MFFCPEVPYVNIADYLQTIYVADFTEEQISDNVYEISSVNGSLTIDTETEVITFGKWCCLCKKNPLFSTVENKGIFSYRNHFFPDFKKMLI